MSQNLLKGLSISLKDFLQKWEKVNMEGKKSLEAVSNALSELRILTAKKDGSLQIYANVCQSIIQEKSSEIIKALDKLSDHLEVLEKIADLFGVQAENISNTLVKSYTEAGEDSDKVPLIFNQIVQNSQALKTMLGNEIQLKRQILKDITLLILQEEESVDKFNKGKFLLQLWIFNPYIKDQLLDDTIKLIAEV